MAIFSTDDASLVRSILFSRSNKIKFKLIITNNPGSEVIGIAKEKNIRCEVFDHRLYPSRVSHEKDIVSILRKEKISLIIFAHYNRLITKYFASRYKNKIINIHPGLLPGFCGAYAYRGSYMSGAEKSGCTIHFVNEGLESGKILLQKEVPRLKEDNFETFKSRVHDTECDAIQDYIQSLSV